ncbi:peptidase metallopeptidase [Richelia sinica FACHB-800]|uniref:Peptidase metallopeptidase n=1 Tax=Richelia sinica FACHB-800 TaxID=1357546 RepID=A0A975Y6D4_9NOST|nr:peptidase [Richelia sinica]MBD2664522.1 peptidase [Richelia sinica FACHB-800]QXE25139.1 peptidase metallopeptidase [Richelia sinica FACHB-800]
MEKISPYSKSKPRPKRFWHRLLAVLTLIISTGLLVILTNFSTNAVIPEPGKTINLSPHPLPPTLAQWQDKSNSGDYFDNVTPTKVGYLIWSQFPVRVKVETPTGISENQSQKWVNSVLQAIQEWNLYLPLQVVENSEIADITIYRKAPPLQIEPNQKIPRARSALTTYELYTKDNILSHRFTILLSPSQTGEYIPAAVRHEIGHALGIWGHSPLPTDALYFSQVRQPPGISARDVNTLKKVYEQPTSLGW